MPASMLASHQLKNSGDEVLGHHIAPCDTHYLKPLTLALYQTRHPSSDASDKIAPALATRLDVAGALNHLRNTGRPEPA